MNVNNTSSKLQRIRPKIVFYMVLILTVSLTLVALDGFFSMRNALIKQSLQELEAIANLQKSRTEELIRKDNEMVQQITNRTRIIDALASFNQTKNQTDIDLLKTRLDDILKSIPDYEDIFILDAQGNQVTSSQENIDFNISDEDKEEVLSHDNEHIHFNLQPSGEADFMLHGPIKQNDQIIGYVVIKADPKEIEAITQDYTGLGQTGETLLGQLNENGDAVYVTKPRFPEAIPDLVITKDQENVAIIKALAQEETTSTNLKDYRGESIFVVTRYITETGWGLVVKIDKSEVYNPVFRTAGWFLTLIVGLLIVVIIVAWKFADKIARPIEKLNLGTHEIEKGNLDYKVGTKAPDEIGQLSRSFDQMVESIIKSRAEIDKKVQLQTQDIVQNQKDIDDQRLAILNVLEDVEDEKIQVSQEKDKINTILQSIGDGVFVVDTNLKIILVNSVTTEITGFNEKELIDKKYNEILKFMIEDDKKGKINDQFISQAIVTGEVQEMSNHTVLLRKNGVKVPVADSAAPLKNHDGQIIGCVVVFRDVTREREIDKAKTEFVSLASHQLRTPLSAINWYTEMLIAGDVGKMTPDQLKYLKEIYKGNQRMVDLVNALLNVSRIELGTFAINPEEMDITQSAKQLIKEVQHDIEKKKIVFSANFDQKLPKINADKKLIEIIIQNLLSNAIKYTPDKGKVILTIENKDPNILITVVDTGLGIPKSQQPMVFNKLFRADNVRQADTEGTGLGLYIVKAIVEQSKGKLWFESEENKGTKFFVSLPSRGMAKKEGNKTLEDIK